MHSVQKTITALAAFLWLLPPLLFLYIWPLPVPVEMLHEIWLYYFAFALAAYLAIRLARSQRRMPVIFGIAAAALALEIFNVVYFHHGAARVFAPRSSWQHFPVWAWAMRCGGFPIVGMRPDFPGCVRSKGL